MSLENVENQNILYGDFTTAGVGSERREHDQGDGNSFLSNKKSLVVEENNNEIDELADQLSKMGNVSKKCNSLLSARKNSNDSGDYNYEVGEKIATDIGDVTNPHNEKILEDIEKQSKKIDEQVSGQPSIDYDYASDDFEEEVMKDNTSTSQANAVIKKSVLRKPDVRFDPIQESNINRYHAKSVNRDFSDNHFEQHRFVTEKEYSVRSNSRSSFNSGSTMKKQRKINMSFSNERSMEIERENSILLRKILRSRSSRSDTPNLPQTSRTSMSIMTKKAQDKIQYENLILLRKIQKAKPTNVSMRR